LIFTIFLGTIALKITFLEKEKYNNPKVFSSLKIATRSSVKDALVSQ